MRNWKYCLLFLSMVLVGCSKDLPQKPANVEQVHINWPVPLEPCPISDVKVVPHPSDPDKAVVVMSWPDYLQRAACEEARYTYIKEANQMICFYRRELNEARCNLNVKEK